MEAGKSAIASKTMWFGAAVTMLGAAQTLDWVSLLGSQKAGLVVSGIGIATMILRMITEKPVTGVVKS